MGIIIAPPRAIFSPNEAFNHSAIAFMREETKDDLIAAYGSLVKTFQDIGINSPNLYESLKNEDGVFFARDHHWTSVGSWHAASDMWSSLMDNGIIDFRHEPSYYTAVDSASSTMDGSYNNVLKERCIGEFDSEYFEYPVVSKVSEETSELLEDSLFGNAQEESILLLGSSFSSERTGLQLSSALSMWFNSDIDNIAVGGAGMLGSSDILMSRGDDFAIPNLSIFEISHSYFSSDGIIERQAFSPLVRGICHQISHNIDIPDLESESWSEWVNINQDSAIIRVDTLSHQEATLAIQVEFSSGERSRVLTQKTNFTSVENRNGLWEAIVAGAGSTDMEKLPIRARFQIWGEPVRATAVYGCDWG